MLHKIVDTNVFRSKPVTKSCWGITFRNENDASKLPIFRSPPTKLSLFPLVISHGRVAEYEAKREAVG